jgi:hypothetical protein
MIWVHYKKWWEKHQYDYSPIEAMCRRAYKAGWIASSKAKSKSNDLRRKSDNTPAGRE